MEARSRSPRPSCWVGNAQLNVLVEQCPTFQFRCKRVTAMVDLISIVKVAILLCLLLLGFRWLNAFLSEWQAETDFGIKRGCLPQPQLPIRWPLGLDWVIRLWQSDARQHLLAFLCRVVRRRFLRLLQKAVRSEYITICPSPMLVHPMIEPSELL